MRADPAEEFVRLREHHVEPEPRERHVAAARVDNTVRIEIGQPLIACTIGSRYQSATSSSRTRSMT